MDTVTIRLLKPSKGLVITFHGSLIDASDTHRLLHTVWEKDPVDIGYVRFEPGDYLYEYYYSDRWYNVFELHAPEGQLKGWYCNIARPAMFEAQQIDSEDLELDLFVSPDLQTIVLLDEEEYAALGLAHSDPAAHQQVEAAVADLRQRATLGREPFHR